MTNICTMCGHPDAHDPQCPNITKSSRLVVVIEPSEELNPAGTRDRIAALEATNGELEKSAIMWMEQALAARAERDEARATLAAIEAWVNADDPVPFEHTTESEHTPANDELARLREVLTYFVCHWPASKSHDPLFRQMFDEALDLTGIIPGANAASNDNEDLARGRDFVSAATGADTTPSE